MDATTVTVQPFGSEQPLTLDLAALYKHFQQVPDLRQRRGVRYPLAVLLTIALWAKLTGASQLRAIAEWARERQGELAARFGLPRATMPHPTTWSRVLASAVAAEALDHALTPLLLPAPAAVTGRLRMGCIIAVMLPWGRMLRRCAWARRLTSSPA